LFSSAVAVSDIRPVTNEDLLGRRTIDTAVAEIAGYLQGRRVLVTGAGGSIGSELCRQITRFAPADLIMLDRDESGLHQVQLSIEGRAMLDSRSVVVCDIRDKSALFAVFDEHRPEVVFHAAALKHLPLLEMWPAEAVKTNVFGTQNLIDAAKRARVARFINISTDKAANPISVLGYSKRLAERLTAAAGTDANGTYLSVRFGNVLGSRGSVLITFRQQIEAGGPVTVTDPEVTRYFMTIEEAVQLVIQGGAIGDNGEALVLDMGEPVRIVDLARQLVAQAPRPVEIVYTGLRPGEKLHEDVLGTGEVDLRPRHPLISHVAVPAIAREWETALHLDGRPGDVVSCLQHWCQVEPIDPTNGCHSIPSASSSTSATATAANTGLR
jgi:FlaA1/EpsC-like NDP-sugar epimerase